VFDSLCPTIPLIDTKEFFVLSLLLEKVGAFYKRRKLVVVTPQVVKKIIKNVFVPHILWGFVRLFF